MSIAPARIAGYSTQGQLIAEKNYANLTVIDKDKSWIVNREKLQSQSKNTPFNGYELPAVVTDVFHNGVQVLKDGAVVSRGNLAND
jgi:dihydroorotase